MDWTRLSWIIKREMVQYGMGIMCISYLFFVYILWRAYFSGFEVTLNFNRYGEGIAELVVMTASIIPVLYVVWNIRKLYPK